MISIKVSLSLVFVLLLFVLIQFFLIRPDEYINENDSFSEYSWYQWQLPTELKEISGLAYLSGILLAHADEEASIYKFDPIMGLAKEWLRLGSITIEDDFEGISFLDDDLYLMTSWGLLYQVQNAMDLDVGSVIEPNIIDTHLIDECELEGLTSVKQALLLLCKVNYRKEDQGFLLVWYWNSETGVVDTWLRLSISDILEKAEVDQFSASALDVFEGKIYVAAARERLLIEINEDRETRIFKLKKKRHRQAEGLAFAEDGSFYIADEGPGKKNKNFGVITFYQSLGDLKQL